MGSKLLLPTSKFQLLWPIQLQWIFSERLDAVLLAGVLGNQGAGATGLLFVEWWLLDYYTIAGSCPSGGWRTVGTAPHISCVLDSSKSYTPYEGAGLLYGLSLDGSATSSQDQATFCVLNTCYSSSGPDKVYLSQNHWTGIQWNVLGYYDGSEADFNVPNGGLGLTITVSAGISDRASLGCQIGGWTGESNNLNLEGSCSCPASYEYVFTEGN